MSSGEITKHPETQATLQECPMSPRLHIQRDTRGSQTATGQTKGLWKTLFHRWTEWFKFVSLDQASQINSHSRKPEGQSKTKRINKWRDLSVTFPPTLTTPKASQTQASHNWFLFRHKSEKSHSLWPTVTIPLLGRKPPSSKSLLRVSTKEQKNKGKTGFLSSYDSTLVTALPLGPINIWWPECHSF